MARPFSHAIKGVPLDANEAAGDRRIATRSRRDAKLFADDASPALQPQAPVLTAEEVEAARKDRLRKAGLMADAEGQAEARAAAGEDSGMECVPRPPLLSMILHRVYGAGKVVHHLGADRIGISFDTKGYKVFIWDLARNSISPSTGAPR
jgi:hypothetical protein